MLKPLPMSTGAPMPSLNPPGGGAGRAREFAGEAANRDTQNKLDEHERWIRNLVEVEILTADGQRLTVLTRGPGTSEGAESGTRSPWEIVKVDGRIVRVYPSAIWDGKGNAVWCSYLGEASISESSFELALAAAPTPGYIWLECGVDDSDDYHGIIQTAVLRHGAAPDFNGNYADSIVNIPLCVYHVALGGGSVTIDPKIPFVFALRRFGPPGSISWEVTPI